MNGTEWNQTAQGTQNSFENMWVEICCSEFPIPFKIKLPDAKSPDDPYLHSQ